MEASITSFTETQWVWVYFVENGFYFIWNLQKFTHNCSEDEGKRKYFQTEAPSHLPLWILQREIIPSAGRYLANEVLRPDAIISLAGMKLFPVSGNLALHNFLFSPSAPQEGSLSSYSWITQQWVELHFSSLSEKLEGHAKSVHQREWKFYPKRDHRTKTHPSEENCRFSNDTDKNLPDGYIDQK